ncbi:hypothetical protein BJ875DRAFT_464131 [Amylocarpus encephaloides]|uniref:Uncharacterized protein n=1 Tax=Amylocarpus encephaloides TaxID=45428 RepID=A0A9P7YI19_9HELO|nr:hypothetical protein BJ875DRAFT_464131 [Amylocarpus encephaloides]
MSIDIPAATHGSLAPHHLIYFITGNPGLIGYYDTFLHTLHQLLSGSREDCSERDLFHVYGQSLAGFEEDLPQTSHRENTIPYSLEEVIDISLESLQEQRIRSGARKGQVFDSVILIGHSVGSYILLEIIRRLRSETSETNIRAGILLFPTVTHIAQSPSGAKISTLFEVPDFPRRASAAAAALIRLTPTSMLRWLVGLVTRMPEDSAAVTTRFLTSKMGIWQALHMAKDEMDTITEDKWDEDIWGIEHQNVDSKLEIPKLVFYFGENDHWVASHTRDTLIAARASGDQEMSSSRPIMLIDENSIPHGFCIRHSEGIAEKVAGWIQTIFS